MPPSPNRELLPPVVKPGRDPLVVGQKQDDFWLVTAFDTTPAEEYVRREFTTGKLGNTHFGGFHALQS